MLYIHINCVACCAKSIYFKLRFHMISFNFRRVYPDNTPHPSHGLWFAMNDKGVLVTRHEGETVLPYGETMLPDLPRPEHTLLLGYLDDTPCFACYIADETLPSATRQFGLRDLYGRVPEAHHAVAGYASQLLLWQRSSNYCSVCGQPLVQIAGEWGKRCLSCKRDVYPPVNPCTITLIHDGDRALLTHKAGWGNRYGLVAGFVEPGESLEDCLRREAAEEVGASVTDITYFSSQPWPYPHQLMLGFFARYTSGTGQIDQNELDEARWTTRDEINTGVVGIPPKLSIARLLIDYWLTHAI